jgi:hypothetical protein
VIRIGNQGRTTDQLIGHLSALAVTRLVDVRLTPVSRKTGLSETALARTLPAAGFPTTCGAWKPVILSELRTRTLPVPEMNTFDDAGGLNELVQRALRRNRRVDLSGLCDQGRKTTQQVTAHDWVFEPHRIGPAATSQGDR